MDLLIQLLGRGNVFNIYISCLVVLLTLLFGVGFLFCFCVVVVVVLEGVGWISTGRFS